MPPRHLPSLTIANSATESEVLDFRSTGKHFLTSLLIVSPTTLPEVVKVHAATKASGTFQPLQSDAVDITIPAAKATSIHPVGMIGAIKLVAAAAVGADRVFEVSGGQAEPT
jgi:hypothetical protein